MTLFASRTRGAKLLDKGLGYAPPDFHDVNTVPAAFVYDLAQSFLGLAIDALDQSMRAAVGANDHQLGSLIAGHQRRLIEEAGWLYRSARS